MQEAGIENLKTSGSIKSDPIDRPFFIGGAGHINGDAGYGPWPEGEQMLLEFCFRVQG